ncbi:MAG TPA: hypothetical protein VM513_09005 [Kofleriaceae bacterium]|jgi:hypothetical protein|nr:hypothetical protein [Kofleriaceae bacterium]
MSPDVVARAFEIGVAVASPLAKLIAEMIDGGASEEEATRKALERLAAQPDLTPVLPKVRAMIIDARKPQSERQP